MGIDESDFSRISRRDILALSVDVLAAVSLGAVCPRISHGADIKFPEGSYGGKAGKKIMVAYASKYGSTGGVADAIAKELSAKGASADVGLVKNASNTDSYQGVVIGSAIYRGKWMSEAVDFVKRNRNILRQMPVSYFLVCMSLVKPTEKDRAQVLAYMDSVLEVVPEIKPLVIGTFAGALHYDNLSWITKKFMKSKGTPEGDFRNWDVIRDWARGTLTAEDNGQ